MIREEEIRNCRGEGEKLVGEGGGQDKFRWSCGAEFDRDSVSGRGREESGQGAGKGRVGGKSGGEEEEHGCGRKGKNAAEMQGRGGWTGRRKEEMGEGTRREEEMGADVEGMHGEEELEERMAGGLLEMERRRRRLEDGGVAMIAEKSRGLVITCNFMH